jgi:predicted house-cleaning noncanonical NTP pyrophosphatase (MazG superfamily)
VKLVRDRIPTLAASNGQPPSFHLADPTEYAAQLRAKLLEEAHQAATTPAELLEELGDVLQVLYALAHQAGYHAAEIECARARKTAVCGSFTRGIVWHDPPSRLRPHPTRPDSD